HFMSWFNRVVLVLGAVLLASRTSANTASNTTLLESNASASNTALLELITPPTEVLEGGNTFGMESVTLPTEVLEGGSVGDNMAFECNIVILIILYFKLAYISFCNLYLNYFLNKQIVFSNFFVSL